MKEGDNNMTFEQLSNIIAENNIPHNVELQSDSGWECCETDMNGVYYDEQNNRLVFTQDGDVGDEWFKNKDIKILYGIHKKCSTCVYLNIHKLNECTFNNKCLAGKDTNLCDNFKEK